MEKVTANPQLMYDNPLLHLEFLIPFDRIQAAQIEPAVRKLLQDSRQSLQALTSDPAPPTYANTMRALDMLTEQLEYAMGIVRHLEAVCTTPELRAAFNKVQPEVSAFYSSLPLDEPLWRRVQGFAATPEASALTGTWKRFLRKTV